MPKEYALVPNKTIASRIKILAVGTAIAFFSCHVHSQEFPGSRYLSCLVVEEAADGEWIASRELTETNGSVSASGDRYRWRPKQPIQFGAGMTLKWDIAYRWPAGEKAQISVPENDVAVSLHFWYSAKDMDAPVDMPERSWIHLYRSANPDERFTSSTTSLTGIMFWHQFNNGNLSTKAVIPLDHVLAFGTGYDTLVWNIRTEPNPFGGTHALAKGTIPVAAMRDKISDIPKLRRMLDKKAKNFRTECPVPPPAPPAPPSPP
jgi:hypothetical protein